MRSNEISYFLSFCIEQYKQKHHLTGAQAIDQITDDQRPVTNKIIKDGQIFLLRGDKTYTATGQEVK
ncbi:MAG: DUF3791 domain-containing protein [Paludibacteraceae bacterium]|nr:DUF3791 domain-containing protein [Paludibacteraceae bacterium]